MYCTRVLGPTDIKYKIICAGSGFDIGCGESVIVSCNGNTYAAKMHSKTKGRIDGLSKLFADFNFREGQELSLEYNHMNSVITITIGQGTVGASTNKCPNCKAVLAAGAKFCIKCGSSVVEQKMQVPQKCISSENTNSKGMIEMFFEDRVFSVLGEVDNKKICLMYKQNKEKFSGFELVSIDIDKIKAYEKGMTEWDFTIKNPRAIELIRYGECVWAGISDDVIYVVEYDQYLACGGYRTYFCNIFNLSEFDTHYEECNDCTFFSFKKKYVNRDDFKEMRVVINEGNRLDIFDGLGKVLMNKTKVGIGSFMNRFLWVVNGERKCAFIDVYYAQEISQFFDAGRYEFYKDKNSGKIIVRIPVYNRSRMVEGYSNYELTSEGFKLMNEMEADYIGYKEKPKSGSGLKSFSNRGGSQKLYNISMNYINLDDPEAVK